MIKYHVKNSTYLLTREHIQVWRLVTGSAQEQRTVRGACLRSSYIWELQAPVSTFSFILQNFARRLIETGQHWAWRYLFILAEIWSRTCFNFRSTRTLCFAIFVFYVILLLHGKLSLLRNTDNLFEKWLWAIALLRWSHSLRNNEFKWIRSSVQQFILNKIWQIIKLHRTALKA